MSIDWNKAPSSATHYLPEQKDLGWGACWYKKDGDKWLVMNCARLEKRDHMEWFVDDSEVDKFVPLLVPRSAFPSEWDGQGLPPVGTVCEYRHLIWPEYRPCEIRYISEESLVAYDDAQEQFYRTCDMLFRPLPTPEQIAAEEREKAINQMISDAGYVDPKIGTFVAMGNLYDAGYRRQESST